MIATSVVYVLFSDLRFKISFNEDINGRFYNNFFILFLPGTGSDFHVALSAFFSSFAVYKLFLTYLLLRSALSVTDSTIRSFLLQTKAEETLILSFIALVFQNIYPTIHANTFFNPVLMSDSAIYGR
jgi:hypothetical protein